LTQLKTCRTYRPSKRGAGYVPTVRQAAVAIAGHTKFHPDDKEGERRLREQLAEVKITTYIEKVIANSPPLSDEAKARIASLLNGGARDD
jgi:hypothetical protein